MPWLPDDFAHPLRLDLANGLHLRPIREADTDIDFPAVMGSRERLWAMFGEVWAWPPSSMTWEQDRLDLARHEREIEAHESFNYALLDEREERVLGCVYIDPPDEPGASYDALVAWWVVDELAGTHDEDVLARAVPAWISDAWPFTAVRYGV